MELRQLAYLVAVAEEGHFTRAAEKTHIAQPAISRQVIQLERELGERLLVRDRTGVRLTDAGRAFLPHARAALAAAQAGRDALASLRGLLTGQLRIGTVLPTHHRLLAVIGWYRREHPGVELRLTEDHNGPLIRSVLLGELDVALIGLGPLLRLRTDVETEQVLAEPVVVAMSSDHPLAARRSLTARQLADEAFVSLPPGSGQREVLETLAAGAGFVPRITAESSDVRLLIELAGQGVGIALVPLSAVGANQTVALIPISRPRLERHLFLIWKQPTLSPAARVWLDQARSEFTHPTLPADRPSS